MRAVVQRVRGAYVAVEGAVVSRIGEGLCCLVGVERGDGAPDIEYVARKVVGLRVFDDASGTMNVDVASVGGGILIVSQFTLLGDVRRGRRPSYELAEDPARARDVFEELVRTVRGMYGGPVDAGVFRAMMDVHIVNNGPVTILLDSRKRF